MTAGQPTERAPADSWSSRLRPWVGPACRGIVGVAFLAAGLVKLLTIGPELVRAEVMTLVPLPGAAASMVAAGLPWFELALGTWLLVDRPQRLAPRVAAATMVVFTLLLARAAWLGTTPEGCLCFGAVSSGSIHLDLARNLALTAMAARAGL